MVEIERELKTERIHHFKALRLIAPEEANRLGIPSESPVFVSPAISSEEKCSNRRYCSGTFKPLIYQVGYEITAHHFHRNSGGIYHHWRYPQEMLGEYGDAFHWPEQHGWVALLRPVGICKYSGFGWPNQARSQGVKVEEIRAYCKLYPCSKRIEEGVIFALDSNQADLRPLCSLKQHPQLASLAKYIFKITEEGQVLFSNLANT